jgi:hypothetical protein
VVIDYFNFGWAKRTIWPLETNSPLIVDANALPSLAISCERLKPVSRKSSKILERGRRIATIELESRRPLESGEGLYPLPILRIPWCACRDNLSRYMRYVKRKITPRNRPVYPYCAENSVLQGGDAERGERSSP